MKNIIKGKYLVLVLGGLLIIIVIGSYSAWNRLDPQHTCAQCHEVSPSHTTWLSSAHAEVQCIECHGTAVSDGFHSLKEKTGMAINHFSDDVHHDDIHLSEKQVLDVSNNCAACHQAEHAGWLASGHAVNYREIFMDSVHNALEKPYWDCFRCHGMFYDGNIHDLMNLDGDAHEWHIKDKKQEMLPTIPCLACHQIHSENPVSERYVSSENASRDEVLRNPRTSLYIRSDKMYLRSDKLIKVAMTDGDMPVKNAGDPNTLLCQQCHAPNYQHHAGSQDDRTPTGVHEGVSCIACHQPHSNNTRQSCALCHQSLTEEEITAVYANPHGYAKSEK